jgi:hypothetical protein
MKLALLGVAALAATALVTSGESPGSDHQPRSLRPVLSKRQLSEPWTRQIPMSIGTGPGGVAATRMWDIRNGDTAIIPTIGQGAAEQEKGSRYDREPFVSMRSAKTADAPCFIGRRDSGPNCYSCRDRRYLHWTDYVLPTPWSCRFRSCPLWYRTSPCQISFWCWFPWNPVRHCLRWKRRGPAASVPKQLLSLQSTTLPRKPRVLVWIA